jgi:hypothetical protein
MCWDRGRVGVRGLGGTRESGRHDASRIPEKLHYHYEFLFIEHPTNTHNPGDVPNIGDLTKLRTTIEQILSGKVISTYGKDSFMFPNQVWTNDHMHMYFNSLEETIKRDEEWNHIDDLLRNGIAAFLSNRGLRQRLQSQMHVSKRHKFNKWGVTHIDWKWEFLETFLNKLEPLLDDLFAELLS